MTSDAAFPVVATRRWRVAVAAVSSVLALAVALIGLCLWIAPAAPVAGQTMGERLTALQTERAALQARADGVARLDLLASFRIASLLSDALVARYGDEPGRAFETLASWRRQPFAEVEALNAALREALAYPEAGARQAARQAAASAQAALDRLAGDGAPLVLRVTPSFVPPRRIRSALNLAPHPAGTIPPVASALPIAAAGPSADTAEAPLMPRYVPDFEISPEGDLPVDVEIAVSGFESGDVPPVLAVGAWRGTARLSPFRLHFSVPRSAFATEMARTGFVTGALSFRRNGRSETFALLFVVLPDAPGSFALDQKVRTTTPEATTLVSPEILARAEAGKTVVVRRCFDPPPGQRFDKTKRRVVEIERLGWRDDMSERTLNDGSVAFAPDEGPNQICVVVTARPVTQDARTATIGRFETALIKDVAEEKTVGTGVRALDWHEAVRVPLQPNAVEWRLYLRLLGDITLSFDQPLTGAVPLPAGLPFVRLSRDKDGKTLILQADPSAVP
jgi:hypothetical protein